MLAQNFLSPRDLGITDHEFETAVKLLGMLERGELKWVSANTKKKKVPNGFNMVHWDCPTSACFGGWMERLGCASSLDRRKFDELYYPNASGRPSAYDAKTGQAAFALRSFLRTGKPQWKKAMRIGAS
jgi:hypothetical protein